MYQPKVYFGLICFYADKFLSQQLLPEVFEQACAAVNQPLNLRYQEGYDHSYYFIASFIEDHIRHHALSLGIGSF